MRTITIEEHFLAEGFREAIKKNAPKQGGGALDAALAAQQAKLTDLGPIRLKDMDVHGIDLQVISHTALDLALSTDEDVRLTQAANDQLAAAVAAHPQRFAGFAALPMTRPEAAVAELERAVRSLGFK